MRSILIAPRRGVRRRTCESAAWQRLLHHHHVPWTLDAAAMCSLRQGVLSLDRRNRADDL
jgi:hypothetical protein